MDIPSAWKREFKFDPLVSYWCQTERGMPLDHSFIHSSQQTWTMIECILNLTSRSFQNPDWTRIPSGMVLAPTAIRVWTQWRPSSWPSTIRPRPKRLKPHSYRIRPRVEVEEAQGCHLLEAYRSWPLVRVFRVDPSHKILWRIPDSHPWKPCRGKKSHSLRAPFRSDTPRC